jgi:hypothetical protein
MSNQEDCQSIRMKINCKQTGGNISSLQETGKQIWIYTLVLEFLLKHSDPMTKENC